jgi:hypothetical protein
MGSESGFGRTNPCFLSAHVQRQLAPKSGRRSGASCLLVLSESSPVFPATQTHARLREKKESMRLAVL